MQEDASPLGKMGAPNVAGEASNVECKFHVNENQ